MVPFMKDVKEEKKMHGYYTERKKALRYGDLVFKSLGSAINSIGMEVTGSHFQTHLSVLTGADRERWFVWLVYL